MLAKLASDGIHHAIDSTLPIFAKGCDHHNVEPRRRLPVKSIEHLSLNDLRRPIKRPSVKIASV